MSIAYLPSLPPESDEERHDSLLAEAFLTSSRSTSNAVIAVNERLLMANGRASTFLDARHHELLWQSVSGQVKETTCSPVIFTVPGRGGTAARCTPIADGESIAGVILTLDFSDVPQLRLVESDVSASIFPGSSVAAVIVRQDFSRLLSDNSFVLVTGESGTGKAFLARQLLGADLDTSSVAIVEARESFDEQWLADFERTLSRSTAIVIQHLDDLDPSKGARVTAMLKNCDPAVRVVATALAPIAACHLLDGVFPSRLHIPPLREHLEDIPAIATELLRSWATKHASFRLTPEARRALWGHEWGGNVVELQSVLDNAVQRSTSKTIEGFCIQLPKPAGAGRGGRVGVLKQDERQKLLDVLAKANNNKLVAADMLGIARSTLYRKIQSLGIASS